MSFIPWQVWPALALIVVLVLAYFAMKRAHEKAAVADVRADAAEGVVKDATDANQIRDRLRSDPEYAASVRDRFTR